MRIILDTDKMEVIVPWNYSNKLEEMNQIIASGGGNKKYDFKSFLQEKWDICMSNTDKHLVVAQKPVKKDKK